MPVPWAVVVHASYTSSTDPTVVSAGRAVRLTLHTHREAVILLGEENADIIDKVKTITAGRYSPGGREGPTMYTSINKSTHQNKTQDRN